MGVDDVIKRRPERSGDRIHVSADSTNFKQLEFDKVVRALGDFPEDHIESD